MDWLLVWGLKEGLVEFATLCIKSWVILLFVSTMLWINLQTLAVHTKAQLISNCLICVSNSPKNEL